jgi:hypothetical protein
MNDEEDIIGSWLARGLVFIGIVTSLLFLLSPADTRAEEALEPATVEHVTTNAAGGEFVLSEKPCDISVRDPANVKLAWSIDETGQKHYGCWTRLDRAVNFEFEGEPGLHTWHVGHFKTRIVGPIGTDPALVQVGE